MTQNLFNISWLFSDRVNSWDASLTALQGFLNNRMVSDGMLSINYPIASIISSVSSNWVRAGFIVKLLWYFSLVLHNSLQCWYLLSWLCLVLWLVRFSTTQMEFHMWTIKGHSGTAWSLWATQLAVMALSWSEISTFMTMEPSPVMPRTLQT